MSQYSEEDLKKFKAEQKHMEGIVYRFFGLNPEGKELFEYLKRYFLLNIPTAHWNVSSNYAYYREGENSMVRRIIKIINEFPKVQEVKNAKFDNSITTDRDPT
jgi:hypothetical protein